MCKGKFKAEKFKKHFIIRKPICRHGIDILVLTLVSMLFYNTVTALCSYRLSFHDMQEFTKSAI